MKGGFSYMSRKVFTSLNFNGQRALNKARINKLIYNKFETHNKKDVFYEDNKREKELQIYNSITNMTIKNKIKEVVFCSVIFMIPSILLGWLKFGIILSIVYGLLIFYCKPLNNK